jgi:uncharacterized DUF497 family protein
VKLYDWNDEKNDILKKERDLSFEEIVFHITHDGLLDVIQHPNRDKYPQQKMFVVNVEGYVCLVPFVENDEIIFLKTIFPSRKMTKKHLGGNPS